MYCKIVNTNVNAVNAISRMLARNLPNHYDTELLRDERLY